MSDVIRYSSTTLSCPDPEALAEFYAALLDAEVTYRHPGVYASIRSPRARLDFMAVEDYRAPRWPDDSGLIHIDFYVGDLEAGATKAERLGATRYEFQPNDPQCLVFADPIGHPFCLTVVDDLN